MATDKIYTGYVITERGLVLVQAPADNRWGCLLADDDQTWDGGFGIATEWEPIDDDDPRITAEDRERLEDTLDWARNDAAREIEEARLLRGH
jgi:hypothetical protein